MKKLHNLIQKLEHLKQQLPVDFSSYAKELAITIKADAEHKIKSKGFGFVYSEKLVPSLYFYGKELNAKGKKHIQELQTTQRIDGKRVKLTNWKSFREAQGLQSSFVDLSYSNEMWRGMFPSEPYKVDEKYFSVLAHTNKEGQEKMNVNKARYGEFILSSADTKKISESFKKRFVEKVEHILRG